MVVRYQRKGGLPYLAYSSYEDTPFIEKTYPIRLSVWNRFLEEILVIPFAEANSKELKRMFPEGIICSCGNHFKETIVIIFSGET